MTQPSDPVHVSEAVREAMLRIGLESSRGNAAVSWLQHLVGQVGDGTGCEFVPQFKDAFRAAEVLSVLYQNYPITDATLAWLRAGTTRNGAAWGSANREWCRYLLDLLELLRKCSRVAEGQRQGT